MSLSTSINAAGSAASAAARMGLDAIGDLTGGSMPYLPGRVTSPKVLAGMINRWAVQPFDRPVDLSAVSVQDVPSVSSNCRNLVLSLEERGERQLPASLFLKLPMENRATRWFMNVIRSWRLESYFFRHVAQTLSIRTPLTYATGYGGTRFFLAQENLHDDPSVGLFTNFDMATGPEPDIVRRCLDTFARLHAQHCRLTPAEREKILPTELHLFLSPGTGPISRSLNRFALKPCMRRQPDAIPPGVAASYALSIRHWDELLAAWFSEPLSLLHGDSHLGNFFQSGDSMGMLDWQAAHWGKGIRDVQYFLINSLPADVLAREERTLVDYYVARRMEHGAPVDADQSWEEYRCFSFHTLFTIVVSIGFGALNEEQDALMAENLSRAVAAVQRLDYDGWLRGYLRGRGVKC